MASMFDRVCLPKEPLPDAIVTETERAYTAGIIDGEGSIMMIHHKPDPKAGHKYEYWQLRISISNTNKTLIDWLVSKYGGRVTIGYSTKEANKDTYMWQQDSKSALPILRAALPYLLLKRRQAELALESIATHKLVGRNGHSPETVAKRRAIAEEISQLNKRGRDSNDPLISVIREKMAVDYKDVLDVL